MSGELIKVDDMTIYVKCTSVAKDQKQQAEICKKCQWHMHPGSIDRIMYKDDDGEWRIETISKGKNIFSQRVYGGWRREYRSNGKTIYCERKKTIYHERY